jgi:hypothetical protein
LKNLIRQDGDLVGCLIEILLRKVKYQWMAFKIRDSKTLQADLDDIFAKFGEHYQLTF